MPRPRKDGQPAARAVRTGKERTTATGKPWRVRAYAPTPTSPYGKVSYIKPSTGKWTSAVPGDDETLDQKFEQVERWLDQGVAMGRSHDNEGDQSGPIRRDIRALGPLYLQWLEDNDCDEGYIDNRRCILNKWIYPYIGSVLMPDWGPEESLKPLNAARGKVGQRRVEAIGSVLSGLKLTAHRRRPGGRWLNRPGFSGGWVLPVGPR